MNLISKQGLMLVLLSISLNLKGKNDSTKWSIGLGFGFNSVSHANDNFNSIPWIGRYTAFPEYYKATANGATLALIKGQAGTDISIGVDYKLNSHFDIECGVRYQNFNLSVLRFNLETSNPFRIASVGDTFYPNRYDLKFHYINIPLSVQYFKSLENKRMYLGGSMGLNSRFAVGNTFNSGSYFNSQGNYDSANYIATGMNFRHIKSFGFNFFFKITGRININERCRMEIGPQFDIVRLSHYGSNEIVDESNGKYFTATINPTVLVTSAIVKFKYKLR